MKKILVAASAIGLLASTPAYAAEGEIALSADVAAQCGVGNHKSGADAAPGWDQDDIVVDLADTNGQFSGQTFTNRSFGNVWCNGPATVTLEVAALTSTNTTTDTSSFTNRFDIKVVTDAGVYVGGGQDYTMDTTGDADGVLTTTASVPGAFETGLQRFGGADSIEILPSSDNKRAVAGDYSGYLRFTATVS